MGADDADISHESDEVDFFALRPVDLPARDALAAAARSAPSFAGASRLARLLDPHGIGGSTRLRLPQAEALAKMLPTGDLDRCRAAGVAVRSCEQLPEVTRLHRIAVAGGLLGDGASVPSGHGANDALERWWRFFAALLAAGILATLTTGRDVVAEIADDLLVHLLLTWYATEALTTDHVAVALVGAAEDSIGPLVDDADEIRQAVYLDVFDGLARRLVPELEGLGIIEATRLEGEEAHAITPLGLWAVNRLLRQLDVDAPVFGELAGTDANTLYATCTTWELEDGQREIASWIAARGTPDAARELADLARTTDDPGARQFAIAVLFALDPAAEPVMRSILDDPILGPHAAVWLVEAGLEDAASLEGVDTDAAISAVADDMTALLAPDVLETALADGNPRTAARRSHSRPSQP